MTQFAPMTGPQQVKLRIEDFELLLESGALDRFPHVELVDGVIVAMNSEYRRHTRTKNEINFRLRDALIAAELPFAAYCEPTISLPPDSLPEPDVIVIDDLDEGSKYLMGAAVRIVIEVADSTAVSDLRYKHELYGTHAIPEYWVFDLREDLIHVFWQPSADGYQQFAQFPLSARLSSVTIDGLAIDTASLY